MLTFTLAALLAVAPSAPAADACGTIRLLVDGRLTAEEALVMLRPVPAEATVALVEAIAETGDPQAYIDLFDVLGEIGDHEAEGAVRPQIFSPDPEVAMAATRALGRLGGPRAVPTLEHVVRTNKSFGQTLAAIEMIRDIGLPSSFGALSREAENEGSHPILRALAVRSLPGLDLLRTRKWVKGLKVAPGADPLFAAEVNRLALLFGEHGGSLR